MDILYVIIGVALLYIGGEWVLTGALSAAEKLNIPKVFSAVVLVGMGTSAPELFVGVNSMIAGEADIAVGNVVGSNIANILLISGLGMVLAPIVHKVKFIGLELFFFVTSALMLFALLILQGGLYGIYPLVMLLMLVVYFILASRRSGSDEISEDIPNLSAPRMLAYLVSGLTLLLAGAKSLVFGAVNLAIDLGVSQAVIGLSIVAIGTSLPELATTIAAARRNQGEMIIGNVLGSNIFNVLLILGVSASIDIMDLPYEVYYADILQGALYALLFVALVLTRRLNRSFGIAFLTLYGFYISTWIGR